MWEMFGIIGLLILFVFAPVLFEGGMGEWVNWAFRRQPMGGFTVPQRLSQLFMILTLIVLMSWGAGIAMGVFPVP